MYKIDLFIVKTTDFWATYDFKGLCYFRFQEDKTAFLLFQFLTFHIETTDVGFILLYTTYYFNKSSQKPLKWIVFLRS